ncbi:methyltransferase domain-containing protein [Pseudoalteromonas sp. Of11M-6]|uniref:methyltransferase domain-containing protein n=1 Tax=Pseudoalteromonas sp. Of11M-6 TaxID=2917754 RepID=UPI001EF4C81B|nr:methyltransferase domain-containing protein [Pseudoalteromonas sp. Of11M-6]MCG7555457.1 methyltransferase domain-containing protein [Pseudoalteromonas sp. Of11M-6]
MARKKQQQKPAPTDRNFAELTHKFKNNIYGTNKGKIREAVLKRDLSAQVDWLTQSSGKRILDVGGGQGQLALFLASLGHHVTVIDISEEMLELAKTRAHEAGLNDLLHFIHAPLQALDTLNLGQFDLVLCHAVLEWLVEQQSALMLLKSQLSETGLLSLMYFNHEAHLMANMVYGNFDYVQKGLKVKQKVGLSPNKPISETDMATWLDKAKLSVMQKTGVRCFHDYLRELSKADEDFDALLALELKYNRQEPYASLGRYTHLMLKQA